MEKNEAKKQNEPLEEMKHFLECPPEDLLKIIKKTSENVDSHRQSEYLRCAIELRHIEQLKNNAKAESKLANRVALLSLVIALGTAILATMAIYSYIDNRPLKVYNLDAPWGM